MIRKMTIDDIVKIVEIEEDVFKTSLGEEFLYNELMLNPAANYFVYEKDNKILGYIGFRINLYFAEMINFAVEKKSQKLGIGTSILKFAIDYLKKQEVKEIGLEVRATNGIAKGLYKKFNFKEIKKIIDYYDDEDGIKMICKL